MFYNKIIIIFIFYYYYSPAPQNLAVHSFSCAIVAFAEKRLPDNTFTPSPAISFIRSDVSPISLEPEVQKGIIVFPKIVRNKQI